MPKIKPTNLSKKQLSNEPSITNKSKEYEVSEGMISDILKEKDRWLAVDLSSYQASLRRERKLSFINIEEALTLWVENALLAGLIISDDILSTKALEFAFLCNEEKFKGSEGWVDNFKKRHNLKQYNMHEEAASAPLQDLDIMRENLHQILKNYDSKDIFNCDETDHITVLFTCNATGTEKMRPLFIHKYENPRVLKNINKKTLPELSIVLRVKTFDNYNEYGIEPIEINIKKCIKYIARAWNAVMQSTIENCWLKTGILPKDDEVEIDLEFHAETQVHLMHMRELEEVQDLIDQLYLENPFTADEFIQYDNFRLTAEMISNEEILKAILLNNPNNQEEVEDFDPLPPITHNEAIKHYDKMILYLEQQEDNFDMKKK
ncbi:tigger transposable element-derived protein 6-like [Rhizophagus irregularis DAOM 181602=DAOM 197198]|nr:tigger transposable element-derived protein 6-like [Rhizophagus irregularis DAOM 181602=DAOM 197198]